MTTTELFAVWRYPDDPAEVTELDDTSTKLVRYLFKKYPAELFPKRLTVTRWRYAGGRARGNLRRRISRHVGVREAIPNTDSLRPPHALSTP